MVENSNVRDAEFSDVESFNASTLFKHIGAERTAGKSVPLAGGENAVKYKLDDLYRNAENAVRNGSWNNEQGRKLRNGKEIREQRDRALKQYFQGLNTIFDELGYNDVQKTEARLAVMQRLQLDAGKNELGPISKTLSVALGKIHKTFKETSVWLKKEHLTLRKLGLGKINAEALLHWVGKNPRKALMAVVASTSVATGGLSALATYAATAGLGIAGAAYGKETARFAMTGVFKVGKNKLTIQSGELTAEEVSTKRLGEAVKALEGGDYLTFSRLVQKADLKNIQNRRALALALGSLAGGIAGAINGYGLGTMTAEGFDLPGRGETFEALNKLPEDVQTAASGLVDHVRSMDVPEVNVTNALTGYVEGSVDSVPTGVSEAVDTVTGSTSGASEGVADATAQTTGAESMPKAVAGTESVEEMTFDGGWRDSDAPDGAPTSDSTSSETVADAGARETVASAATFEQLGGFRETIEAGGAFDQPLNHFMNQLRGLEISGLPEGLKNFQGFTGDDIGRVVGALREQSLIVHPGDSISVTYDAATESLKIHFELGAESQGMYPDAARVTEFNVQVIDGKLVADQQFIPHEKYFMPHPTPDASPDIASLREQIGQLEHEYGLKPGESRIDVGELDGMRQELSDALNSSASSESAALPATPPALESIPYGATVPAEVYSQLMEALNAPGVTSVSAGNVTFSSGGNWAEFSAALNDVARQGGTISFEGGDVESLEIPPSADAAAPLAASQEASAEAATSAPAEESFTLPPRLGDGFDSPAAVVFTMKDGGPMVFVGGPSQVGGTEVDYVGIINDMARGGTGQYSADGIRFAARVSDGAIYEYVWSAEKGVLVPAPHPLNFEQVAGWSSPLTDPQDVANALRNASVSQQETP